MFRNEDKRTSETIPRVANITEVGKQANLTIKPNLSSIPFILQWKYLPQTWKVLQQSAHLSAVQ